MATIGIDIGGTSISVCRANQTGMPDDTSVITFGSEDRDTSLRKIVDAVRQLEPGDEPIFGIACGSPMDTQRGVIMAPPNLPDWVDVAICDLLTDEFGGRAWVMNDANAGALAEWRFGAGQGSRHMAFLTCGTGIGSGLILNGQLYEGATGDAGEIGHVKLTEDGPEGFGVIGSVEGWCSGAGIAKVARRLLTDTDHDPGLEHGSVTAKWVIESAFAGNAFAQDVLHRVGQQLGRSLAILIDVLNLDRIVLGSNYYRAEKFLAGPVREAISEHALGPSASSCEVVASALREELGLVAALAVAEYRQQDENAPLARCLTGSDRVLDELVERIPSLSETRNDIQAAFDAMCETFNANGKLLICGNGGSASDSEHIAGELLKGFESKRPLPQKYGLPDGLDSKLQQGLPVIPLTGFLSLRTAVANDCDPRLEFAQLVEAMGQPQDMLMCLSTSGGSANVCLAAQVAQSRGMKVLALTGRSGGALAQMADVAIRVPADQTRLVQEFHLPVYHALCLMLEATYFPSAESV